MQLPEVRLARVRGSAHRVERTAAVIDRSPADSVAVYLTLRGDASFASADGTRDLRPGDALVCATDRPFARGFARGLEELVVTVPCAALRQRAGVAPTDRPAITSFAAGSPAALASGGPPARYPAPASTPGRWPG